MKHYILDVTSDNDTQEVVNNIDNDHDDDNGHDSDVNSDDK